MAAVRHFGYVGVSLDHPRRPIRGGYPPPCKNVVMIGFVVFKLEEFEILVVRA